MSFSQHPRLITVNFSMSEKEIPPRLRKQFTWMDTRRIKKATVTAATSSTTFTETSKADSSGVPIIFDPTEPCSVAPLFQHVIVDCEFVAASYCCRHDRYPNACYFFAPREKATISEGFLKARQEIWAELETLLLKDAWVMYRLDKNFNQGGTEIAINLNKRHPMPASCQLVYKRNKIGIYEVGVEAC